MPRIPNDEMVNARSLVGLMWGRESGGISPVPSHKSEGFDVGILRRGACPAIMEIPSEYEELMWESLGESGQGLARFLMFILGLRKITGNDVCFLFGVENDFHCAGGRQ